MSRENRTPERYRRQRAWPLLAVIAFSLVAVAVVVLWRGDFQLPSAAGGPDPSEAPANGVLVSAVTAEGIVTWTLGDQQTRVIVPPPAAPEFDVLPQYSPDGTAIAFLRVVSETSMASLTLVNSDGMELRALTDAHPTLRRFDWAPSSQEIAYTADTDEGWAVFVVGIGPGDRPRPVATFRGGAFMSDVLWHPAGDRIIVRTPAGELVTVGRGGGEVIELVKAGSNFGRSDVSPDGRQLAFTTAHGLHVMDLATGVKIRRTPDRRDESVEFSPDGKWLATTQRVEGGIQVFIRPYDASSEEAVGIGPVFKEGVWSLFSPDGTTMVIGPYSDSSKAWAVDLATREVEAIAWAGEPPADWQPVWP